MKIMTKKVLRELWFRKFRSLLVILIFALTVGVIIGLRASYPAVMDSYNYNREYYSVADGRFIYTEPINQNNVSVIVSDSDFLSQAKIASIEGRVSFLTHIYLDNKSFPAIVYGINYPNKINKIVIERHSADVSVDNIFANPNNCLIETRFAGKLIGQDIKLDTRIGVDFLGSHINFTIKGVAQDTDHLYMVDPITGMPLIGQMAIIWVDISYLQQLLFSGMPYINEILFTVQDRLNATMTLEAANLLLTVLTQNNAPPYQFVLADETDDYQMFQSDAGSMDKFGTVFGVIGIFVCIVAIFNTLNKIIVSQKQNIGLFLAMGSSKRAIIEHYVLITFILGVIGTLLGMILGYLISMGAMSLVISFYSLHQVLYTFNYAEYIAVGAIVILFALIVSVLSVWSITTATPREAMSVAFTRIKITGKTLFEKLFGWIPLFKPLHMHIPVREVFLKKKRTLITIFALATSAIFLIDSFALSYQMVAIVLNNFNKYNSYDVELMFTQPTEISDISAFLHTNGTGVTHHEFFISIYPQIYKDGEFLNWIELRAYQENSTIRHYHVIKGSVKSKADLTPDSIIIGQTIASKYDINVGDTLMIGGANHTLSVQGLVGELIDTSLLWTLESFRQSNIGAFYGITASQVNGLVLKVSKDTDLEQLHRLFQENFGISYWSISDDAKEAMLRLMEATLEFQVVFILVGLAIAVIFSFNSMYLAFTDRQMDFVSFKAMGIKTKILRKMIFWENAILVVVSMFVIIPIGSFFYAWSIDYMLGERFYIPKTIPWWHWIIVFLLLLLSLFLATWRLIRRYKKMFLPDVLRQTNFS